MAPPTLYVNDLDIAAAFGLRVFRPQGWGDGEAWTDAPVPVPGHAGVMIPSHEAQIAPRTLTISGILVAASATAARAQWDAFKRHIAGSASELRYSLWPDRVALARYQSVQELEPGRTPSKGVRFAMTWLMANPHFLGRQADVYTAVDGSRVRVALGTAPSVADFVVIGTGQADPAVHYVDARGLLRGVLGFDMSRDPGNYPTLAAGSWIGFDGATLGMELHHASTGAVENAAPYLEDEFSTASGSDVSASSLFVLDPLDGDGVAGPSLKPVNCNLIAYVRKAWL